MDIVHLAVVAIALITCLAGGLALLLRMARERERLVRRYGHIKAVMAYEEQLKAHQKQMQCSVARQASSVADYVAEPVDGDAPDVAEVVAEPATTPAQSR